MACGRCYDDAIEGCFLRPTVVAIGDFGFHVFPKLAEHRQPIYGYLLKDNDYLVDIGTIDNYEKVNEEVKNAGR